jgi:polysaccharide export outer membrane protein
VLQADDIVFLPSNALKAAIKSGGIGVVTSIASLLIIASQNR